jgi:simple sugar transport system substrate-binding protein
MSSRRDFLKYSVIGAGSFVLGTGLGWSIKQPEKVVIEKPRPQPVKEELKAAWIYVGPIGDYGWTHAHDVGRREAEEAFPWLETGYVENIDEAKTEGAIQQFIDQGYKVIFTTSFDHMNPTFNSAAQNRDIIFFHCSGYRRRDNMGTYFADLYQIYYLNGLMAGALTKSNKIGYVAAHLIPEVIRHINAFTIGASEVNPNITMYVIEIGAWFAPDKAKEAAATLVEQLGADVLAFTEDTPSTIQFAQSYFEEKGIVVPVFSHYSPMYEYGRDVVPSGQLVRWGPLYKDILAKVYSGLYTTNNLENVDYWWLLNSGSVDLGAETYGDSLWISPKFEDSFRNTVVTDKLTGESLSLYQLIEKRYSQMKDNNLPYEPFTGPLRGRWWLGSSGTVLGKEYSKDDTVTIPQGIRLGHYDLWNMGWFLENVVVQD